MNGINFWWQKHTELRAILKEFKKDCQIKGDVKECVEMLLCYYNNVKKEKLEKFKTKG